MAKFEEEGLRRRGDGTVGGGRGRLRVVAVHWRSHQDDAGTAGTVDTAGTAVDSVVVDDGDGRKKEETPLLLVRS